MKKIILSLFFILIFPSIAVAQNIWIDDCQTLIGDTVINPYGVSQVKMRIRARVCVDPYFPSPAYSGATVHFYPQESSSPGYPPPPSQYSSHVNFSSSNGGCVFAESPDIEVPAEVNTIYHAYCVGEPDDSTPTETTTTDNIYSKDWKLGPELWISSFWYELNGTKLDYHVTVCNSGFAPAKNFRVGLYFHRDQKPQSGQYGDVFEPIEELGGATCYWWWAENAYCQPNCKEINFTRNPVPNGYYKSWAKVDSGEFVEEIDETNNVAGPQIVNVANADLLIEKFEAIASKSPPYVVNYNIRVCNRGAGIAKVFWLDVYFHRDDDNPPGEHQPGEWHQRIENLRVNECRNFSIIWTNAYDLKPLPGNKYQSYAQVDSDLFVPDPKRGNNLEGPITVVVPGGDLPPGCPDHDNDGYGRGLDCTGSLDCDDNNPNIKPGIEEICGNNKDDNCNLSIDDGCPGVDCKDNDGDGWPSGPDCIKSDCDDSDPSRHPGAGEICGDYSDNDCDGYIDDCCDNVDYCDHDDDGACVGSDCPGARDPDCVKQCNGNIDCIKQCPYLQDPDCVKKCAGNQDCIDECYYYDPDCVKQCNGDHNCIIQCPPADDGDDYNPNCTWLGSKEKCGDHLDNDCDGLIDDGCPGTYCNDNDGDGYGTGPGCTSAQDCDDSDPNVHPGAEEICGNGKDDNCDGVPEGMCQGCYDTDQDGYFAGDGTECIGLPKDCDDSDPRIHPKGHEICGNDIDENCNYSTNDVPCIDPIDAQDCADILDPQQYEECLDQKEEHNIDKCLSIDTNQKPPCHEPSCVYACWKACGEKQCDTLSQCIDNCSTWDENDICQDKDGDGYGSGKGCVWEDCNDSDSKIYPGAEEICDGIDQNCNNTIDDVHHNQDLCPDPDCVDACGANQSCIDSCNKVQCVDYDGDGWGSGPDCNQDYTDPDDADPSVHPNAIDKCGDFIDQDGDGISDEGCDECIDHDGDGYGVGSGCPVQDCDDTDPKIHPGAKEVCGDKDLNCDGIPPSSNNCSGCACKIPARSSNFPWSLSVLLGLILTILRRKLNS